VKVNGSFGSSNQKPVDFRSLRAGQKASSRLETMGFRRADVELLRELAAGSCRKLYCRGKGPRRPD